MNEDYSGTDGRKPGFTLIELLIVVVIIGILAAIALPKFGATREQALLSSMKSDLRNLQTAMEMYYHNNMLSYDGAQLGTPALSFAPTELVQINLSTEARGWSAVATHPGTAEECAIFIGTATAVAPATDVGAIRCASP